jgi:hypothetical protein
MNILVFFDFGTIRFTLFAKKFMTDNCVSTLGHTWIYIVFFVKILDKLICTSLTHVITKNEWELTPAIFASGIVGRRRKGHY